MDNSLLLFEEELKLRGYSRKTQSSYINQVSRFLSSGLSAKDYLLKLINSKSNQTVRQAGFAIKLFDSLYGEGDVKDIPNIKRNKKLPVVLSKKDIFRLINFVNNLQHRLIIKTLYSSGLRVSEVVSLRWEDIDFSRNTIHLKQAKGKKDRLVMLSKKVRKELLDLVCDKKGYVFKTTKGSKYSIRSIETIVSNSAKRLGLKVKVTPHTLRHSFATHLLEDGVDIRIIKDLLGHSDIKTTLVYTQVSNHQLSKIRSPLD